MGGLVLGAVILKEEPRITEIFLKEKMVWEPRLTYVYIRSLPVGLGKTEFAFGGGGYVNERRSYDYLITTSWSAERFRVVIESFSEGLQVLDRNNRVETAPYVLQEGRTEKVAVCGVGMVEPPKERLGRFSFAVIMPDQAGRYELDLSITLYDRLVHKEYKLKYAFNVQLLRPKQPPEAYLAITLDKETYRQGDVMTITIENTSNETVEWWVDAIERYNGDDWEFHDVVGATIEDYAPLEPGETKHLTWKLDATPRYPNRPYTPGRYRVFTRHYPSTVEFPHFLVYVEFEVIE